MGRKKSETILYTELGGKVLIQLLLHKENITGYQVAKGVYLDSPIFSPIKVYGALRRFNEEGLTTTKPNPQHTNGLFHSINFLAFTNKINELRLPEDSKLNQEEVKELSDFLAKIDYSTLQTKNEPNAPFSQITQEATFFEILCLFLYYFAKYDKEIAAISKKKLRLATEKVSKSMPPAALIPSLFSPFNKLSSPTKEKLKKIQLDPKIAYAFNIITSTAQLIGNMNSGN